MLAATPAPQAIVDLKTGMKRDGTLTALQARVVYDSGAFPGAPMLPGCLLIGGYYKCENLDIHGYEVLTNKVSVGALRAPGAHNVTFAIEGHMDIMARARLDPLEVRLQNAVEEGAAQRQPYQRHRVPGGDRKQRGLEASPRGESDAKPGRRPRGWRLDGRPAAGQRHRHPQ
jgi:CO/xanthine dehydrogenase Mo-binding subunit